MSEATRSFYDRLADVYPLLYDDYGAELRAQGDVVDGVIERFAPRTRLVVDLTAGVGTQALPLAARGRRVHAFDLSPRCVRALREQARRQGGVDVRAAVHDFTTGPPPGLPAERFVAFLVLGNSLAFVDDEQAVAGLRAVGPSQDRVLIGSSRDYDAAAIGEAKEGCVAFEDRRTAGSQRVTHRWIALGGDKYRVEIELVGAVALSAATVARARSRRAIEALLASAGATETRWIEPKQAGFYQPIFVAR